AAVGVAAALAGDADVVGVADPAGRHAAAVGVGLAGGAEVCRAAAESAAVGVGVAVAGRARLREADDVARGAVGILRAGAALVREADAAGRLAVRIDAAAGDAAGAGQADLAGPALSVEAAAAAVQVEAGE